MFTVKMWILLFNIYIHFFKYTTVGNQILLTSIIQISNANDEFYIITQPVTLSLWKDLQSVEMFSAGGQRLHFCSKIYSSHQVSTIVTTLFKK